LDGIEITDPALGVVQTDLILRDGSLPLAPGASLFYYYETLITYNLLNTAYVTAQPTDEFGTIFPGLDKVQDHDSAEVREESLNLQKSLLTPQAWFAIGDTATFSLRLTVPAGDTNNFVVTDNLPVGLVYVDGSQRVQSPVGFSSSKPPLFSWDSTTRKLVWDFGDVQQTVATGNLVITYDVRVENVISNQDGIVLSNNASLTYGDNQHIGPVEASLTVGEPNLYLEKTPQTTPVDLQAGDSLRYRVEFWNNGHTTAWQMDWRDVLPNPAGDDGLYLIRNASLTVVAGDVSKNGTSVPLTAGDLMITTTTATDDTIALPPFAMTPGSHFYVEFDCRLQDSVVAGSLLTNRTAVDYASQPIGSHIDGVRDCENSPCDDDIDTVLNNYGEEAVFTFEVKGKICIVKTLVDGDDRHTIGEVFSYNLRTWIIEGISPAVVVQDDIPTGLSLTAHRISFPSGISFSNPDYDMPLDNVYFVMGDVTNVVNGNSLDDWFDIELTVMVDNLMVNQDGRKEINTATLQWDGGADVTSNQIVTEVVEPDLRVRKTVFPAFQIPGGKVTYTIVVGHSSVSHSEAFDLVITDKLPTGTTLVSSSEINYGNEQELEFRREKLPQAEIWKITYTVVIDEQAATEILENRLNLKWASIPGATGEIHNGRIGRDCDKPDSLNNYCDDAVVPLNLLRPGIALVKTVYEGHDKGASCPGSKRIEVKAKASVTYCFRITNNGDTWLDHLSLSDPDMNIKLLDLTLCPGGKLPLAPGASVCYYYETTATKSLVNHAKACARPVDEQGSELPYDKDLCATDEAEIIVVDESIPTLDQWGFLLFMILAGWVGWRQRRRYQSC
jgi:fimbrial isopeptide formation D2 family protein/uncharacterized repeat protein (TIGR01451 family)